MSVLKGCSLLSQCSSLDYLGLQRSVLEIQQDEEKLKIVLFITRLMPKQSEFWRLQFILSGAYGGAGNINMLSSERHLWKGKAYLSTQLTMLNSNQRGSLSMRIICWIGQETKCLLSALTCVRMKGVEFRKNPIKSWINFWLLERLREARDQIQQSQ